MGFTDEQIELAGECIDYYLTNKERSVSYDEYRESKVEIQKILDKIHKEVK